MKTKAIDFVMYSVPDTKRAYDFYKDTLGLDFELIEEGKFWTEFDSPPVAFALVGPGEDEWNWTGTPAIALAVDDIHAAVDELRAKDVKILNEPIETNVCFMAFVEDPFGNRICIHQRKDGTSG